MGERGRVEGIFEFRVIGIPVCRWAGGFVWNL
jgi:hypothetical protein